jgi:hypothetical protein
MSDKHVLFVGNAPGGNYQAVVARAMAGLPKTGLFDVRINHDDWCSLLISNGTLPCDCEPEVVIRQMSAGPEEAQA